MERSQVRVLDRARKSKTKNNLQVLIIHGFKIMGFLGYTVVLAIVIEIVLLAAYMQNRARKWLLWSALIWLAVFVGVILFTIYSFSKIF